MHWFLPICLCSIAGLGAAFRVRPKKRNEKAHVSTPPEVRRVHSAGCTSTAGGRFRPGAGQEGYLNFNKPWTENRLDTQSRPVGIHVPAGYNGSEVLPVVFIFHGWGEKIAKYHRNYDFKALADRERFIVVYPQGLADCASGAGCTGYGSWNAVGTSSTGSSGGGRTACNTSVHTSNYCYSSCKTRKGSCNACDWTTCYDDAAFIADTLDDVIASYCVDPSKVFAWGCSNGGLMVHELAQKLPGRFAGIVAGCGGKPHEGWQYDLPSGGPPISMMLISGDNDQVIPLETPPPGTSWWDGFRYASWQSTAGAYKDYNGCQNGAARTFQTPYTANNMKCTEEGYRCQGGTSVVNCIFNGGHDVNTGTGADSLQDEPQLAWAFFQSTYGGVPAPAPPASPPSAGCTCNKNFPYCWSQDQFCYKSATSNQWHQKRCAGNCTANYGG